MILLTLALVLLQVVMHTRLMHDEMVLLLLPFCSCANCSSAAAAAGFLLVC